MVILKLASGVNYQWYIHRKYIISELLEIDNLQLAIMQADDYRHYERLDPKYKETDAERKAYWQDLYQKLVQL